MLTCFSRLVSTVCVFQDWLVTAVCVFQDWLVSAVCVFQDWCLCFVSTVCVTLLSKLLIIDSLSHPMLFLFFLRRLVSTLLLMLREIASNCFFFPWQEIASNCFFFPWPLNFLTAHAPLPSDGPPLAQGGMRPICFLGV
jgi:hypothetical protein